MSYGSLVYECLVFLGSNLGSGECLRVSGILEINLFKLALKRRAR